MKTNLRNYVTSALLLLPGAGALVAVPASAIAQPATPEIRSLQVEADGRLEPGSDLTFRLVGTPRVRANIRISGLRVNIPLQETSPGVYVGRYTLKRGDDVDRDTGLRAVLRHGNRQTSANYALADTITRPVVVVPPRPVRPADPLRIERFGMAPIERIEPGAELNFSLEGMPGARVTIDLPGIERDVPLREVRPGHYEGDYTIRRADNFNPNLPIVATLRVGDRAVTASLALPVSRASGDNRPPQLADLVPREGDTVPAGPFTEISAGFEDRRGSGVDPASVRIVVSGRNVTPEARITPRGFTLRAALPPGRHSVDVTARDQAGNTVRRTWSFEVAAVPVAAPVVPAGPASLAVQVLNHYPSAEIGPDPVLFRARTAPNASVAINVRAVAPPGWPIDHSRTVYAQTLQADREGIFSFTLVPGIPVPGTRYDINMVARHDNRAQESRFSLMQR